MIQEIIKLGDKGFLIAGHDANPLKERPLFSFFFIYILCPISFMNCVIV